MRRPFPLAVLLLAAGAAGQQGPDPQEFLRLQPVLQHGLARVAGSVVTVETFGGTRRDLTGDGPAPDAQEPERPRPDQPPPPRDEQRKKLPLRRPGFQQAQGRSTGVVLTADGWILVSRFALNFDPTTILVTLPDGRTLPAERKGEDTSRGLALLRVEAAGLPVPEFVPPETVAVGQWAMVLGRTFGSEDPTCHVGIVSAQERQFGRALQLDAYTSPANYGGAVVDVQGRVLGVAVPLSPAGRDAGVEWYDSGIGFCATIADIPELLARMQQGEVLHRGWLGIGLDTTHLGPGAKLAQVPSAGVAAQAGLRKGDVIEAIDGVPVKNGFHLQMLVSSRMGGEAVGMQVRRPGAGEPVSLTVLLQDMPSAEREERPGLELPPSFPLPGGNEGR